MQKKFTKKLILFMIIGMLVITVAIFVTQHVICTQNARSSQDATLKQVQEKLASNDGSTKELRETLDANFLAKARAFAEMIKLNPDILDDFSKMEEIAKLLDVAEVHVTDENGILLWGNIKDYYGFDFATSDQTKPFLEILDDPSLEMAQDPQPNGTTGKLFQYISVARTDAKGIVQVGLEPTVLEDALASNSLSNVLSGYFVENSGYVFAIHQDGTIAAHENADLIGTDYKEAGFSQDVINAKTGSATEEINGENVMYTIMEYGDSIVGVAMPVSSIYSQRNSQTVIFFIFTFFIFAILIFTINSILKLDIVKGINEIIDDLKKITAGDLDITVDLKTNKEFIILSGSINDMVASIEEGFTQNKQRISENNQILEEQKNLFESIKEISGNINSVSSKTLEISRSINDGAIEQSQTVETVTETIKFLSEQAGNNAEVSQKVSQTAYQSSERVAMANESMRQMQESMKEIAENSEKIKSIINNIDGIASQTNLLALNAAIEAARAGDAGKGFAVVAGEVSELAAQSATAASETKQLIQNALTAVEKGDGITERLMKAFSEIIGDTQKVGEEIGGMVMASKEQAEAVKQVASDISQISVIVERNAEVAEESEATSGELAELVEKLNNRLTPTAM